MIETCKRLHHQIFLLLIYDAKEPLIYDEVKAIIMNTMYTHIKVIN